MEIAEIYELYKICSEVCTDTRKITENCIFFALKGANFNGNTFAEQALEKGAKYVVIDEKEYQKDERFVLVEDVLTTLQNLANHHRHQFTIPFIGLTGSNGKTTTKELIRTVLAKKYKVYATEGNFNNHIGVPLTLLSIPLDEAEIAVIEMGANAIGDIELLCNIAEPSHGLITNIGKAHIEGFGSFEGVARAKSELYMHLLANDGVVFINAQNEHLYRMSKRFKNPMYYLGEETYYNVIFKDASPFIEYESPNGELIETQLIGAYNFENVATALCLGKYFGVDDALSHQAIQEYVPTNSRSQVIKKERNTILMDAYNANPSSMQAALTNFEQMNANNKVLILGDMFELGHISKEEHQYLVEKALEMPIEKALFYGKEFAQVTIENDKLFFFSEKEDLLIFLKENPLQDTFCLVKGSRGSALEDVLDYIQ
ncbi:MAG: UDP-N-acetylmuramoyl-tripeptide--D-alanyl-D-alanine ligase [Cytophagales bacterium]|nr:UDP-N-acetylmuramoyl-tripeptide--D-alanyl-D-alanine ligase [Cytophagales bacterium]